MAAIERARTQLGLAARNARRKAGRTLDTVREGVLDAVDSRRDPPLPPRRMRRAVGGADTFTALGDHVVQHLVELGGLQPAFAVLDVGCGSGRVAMPLARYLDSSARYEGFDTDREAIEWCQSHVTPRHPNFRFQFADLYNELYNPAGRYSASEYRFPYEDASFDLVFLRSVFTHMLPDDMDNYLAEVARVLKAGRRSVITFFLINRETEELIERGLSMFRFEHRGDRYRAHDPAKPEAAIAYEEVFIRDLYASKGLEILEPIHFGSWPGRAKAMSVQDIVVSTKPASR